jgi:hypothetical protein
MTRKINSPIQHTNNTISYPEMAAKKRSLIYRKILSYYNISDDPKLLSEYDSLFGYGPPIEDLVASNLPERTNLAATLLKTFTSSTDFRELEIAVQIQRLGITSVFDPQIDISTGRKKVDLHRKTNVGAIAAINFYPVPDTRYPLGVGIVIEAVSILFGQNAQSEIAHPNPRRRRWRISSPLTTSITWLEPGNDEMLKEAFGRMLTPSLTGNKEAKRDRDLIFSPEWTDEASPEMRAFVSFMALTMLPIKRQLLCSGAGKPLVASAIANAEHRFKIARKRGPSPIHRDGVTHFWFSELRRLGLDDLKVPLIKLR